jgi:hypothetical protein
MLLGSDSLLNEIAALVGASSLGLGNASVALITAPFVMTPGQFNFNGLTEANFDGYARQAAAFAGTPFIDENGIYTIQGGAKVFQPSDTITSNTVYGYVLTGSSSSTVMGGEVFNAPIPLTGPTTALTIIPRFGVPVTGALGFAVVAD